MLVACVLCDKVLRLAVEDQVLLHAANAVLGLDLRERLDHDNRLELLLRWVLLLSASIVVLHVLIAVSQHMVDEVRVGRILLAVFRHRLPMYNAVKAPPMLVIVSDCLVQLISLVESVSSDVTEVLKLFLRLLVLGEEAICLRKMVLIVRRVLERDDRQATHAVGAIRLHLAVRHVTLSQVVIEVLLCMRQVLVVSHDQVDVCIIALLFRIVDHHRATEPLRVNV